MAHFRDAAIIGPKASSTGERCRTNLRGQLILTSRFYRTRVPKHLLVGPHRLLLPQRWLNDDSPDEKNSKASKARSVGATNLNRASSRSHAVLTVEMNILDEERQKSRSFTHVRRAHSVLTLSCQL